MGDPRNGVASPPKLIPTLSGLHIDPPDSVTPPNPEDGEKGHPGSRGSSDAWITGSLGPGGAFPPTMFGSGPSSDSGQSLSPLRRSPPLDEHRAYSHQEARAEQMYRDMAPQRFEENRLRSGVNTPQEPQVTGAALAAGSFSSGFSGGSLPSSKVSGPDSAMDVFGRSEGLDFMRMYGGFRDDNAMREALSAPREGVNVLRDVANVSRDGVNGPRDVANMPRDGVNVSRDGVNVPRDVQLSNGGHTMTAYSRAPDGWLPKQEEGARLSMAFEQERRSEMDRDTAQLEVRLFLLIRLFALAGVKSACDSADAMDRQTHLSLPYKEVCGIAELVANGADIEPRLMSVTLPTYRWTSSVNPHVV